MATMRELKRRIGSVQSSQKITGAMKMISSARLRKAENALNRARPYQEQLKVLLNHITEADCEYRSPYRIERRVKKVAIIVFASNEGLCGAFNISLFKKLEETVKEYREMGATIQVYPVGRKIVGDVKRLRGIEIKPIPDLFEQKKYAEAVKELADILMAAYVAEETDRVDVIFTHYKSVGIQTLSRIQLLPLMKLNTDQPAESSAGIPKKFNYIYEPDCETIFKELYPLIIRTILYKALLENQTSEQAVRIISMQTANDNAIKLLGKLQLEYNKLRQQGITTELLDMAGGSIQQ